MWVKIFAATAMCLLLGGPVASCLAEDGAAENLGKKIDKGIDRLGKSIQKGWADVRKSVENMTVQGRVYSRLHWDKALESAAIDIDVRDQSVVVLKGTVPDLAARAKANLLARDTVGVTQVVDELAIGP